MGVVAPRPAARPDQELVSAVRAGDDRAFEALYARYQRRITAYIGGMVRDPSRAEDITQEVFVSALRRMRETDRSIAFKPWLYEIAKNACIDAYRRSRRAEEVSYDAEEGLAAADYGRLVAAGAGPAEAVGAKQELEHLTGAFGGLSKTHHEILVLRELEGRSYADIGERLGMTRGAVESTLFRARKRLGEEYEELASGRRCERVQALITEGEVPRLGARDQRKLARHLAHCQTCRRLATLTGVEVPAALPKRAADKLRSLLPIPVWFGRGGGGGGATMAQLGASSGEPLVQAWSKAIAALVALAVAGAGVGVQPPTRCKPQVTLVAPPTTSATRRDSGGAGQPGTPSATAGSGGGTASGKATTRSSGATSRAGEAAGCGRWRWRVRRRCRWRAWRSGRRRGGCAGCGRRAGPGNGCIGIRAERRDGCCRRRAECGDGRRERAAGWCGGGCGECFAGWGGGCGECAAGPSALPGGLRVPRRRSPAGRVAAGRRSGPPRARHRPRPAPAPRVRSRRRVRVSARRPLPAAPRCSSPRARPARWAAGSDRRRRALPRPARALQPPAW